MDAIDLLFLWEENKQIKKNPNTNQRVFSALFVTIGSLNDLIFSIICDMWKPISYADTQSLILSSYRVILVESSLK